MLKERVIWIDGLKFIACFIVFLGHYYSAFGFLINTNSLFIQSVYKIFHAFIFGNWWVYVFCIISGWLATKRHITYFKDLIYALTNRYVRFVLPIFVANLLVYAIWVMDGFSNYAMGTAYDCEFLMEPYQNQYSLSDVFVSSLLLDNRFIGPLWVLRDILIGNCLTYTFIFLKNNFYKGILLFAFIFFSIICMGGWICFREMHSDLYYVLLTLYGGEFLKLIWNKVSKVYNKRLLLGITLLISILLISLYWLRSYRIIITMIAIIFTTLIPYSYLKNLLSISMMEKISKLSFTIYLLHGPILFSFSVWVFYSLGSVYNLSLVFWLNLIVSVLFLITTCYLYYMLIERRIDILINSIKTFILKKS